MASCRLGSCRVGSGGCILVHEHVKRHCRLVGPRGKSRPIGERKEPTLRIGRAGSWMATSQPFGAHDAVILRHGGVTPRSRMVATAASRRSEIPTTPRNHSGRACRRVLHSEVPGGLAMAVAVASVEDVEEGHLPSVCAKTGRPADGFTTLEFASAPGWTWILLLFGIFPFLYAQHFASRRFYARIPVSDLALRRIYAFKWTYRIFSVAAAFLLAIGWLLSEAHGPTLLLIGVITLGVTLAFWAVGGLFVFPTGRVGDEFVTMSFVNKRFADEVDRWYGG